MAIGGNTVLGRSADIVAMLKACNSVLLTVRPSSELLFQVNPELKKEVRLTQDSTSFKLSFLFPILNAQIDSFVHEHSPPVLHSSSAACDEAVLRSLTIPPPPDTVPKVRLWTLLVDYNRTQEGLYIARSFLSPVSLACAGLGAAGCSGRCIIAGISPRSHALVCKPSCPESAQRNTFC